MICADSACMGYDPVSEPVYIKMSSDTHQVTYQVLTSHSLHEEVQSRSDLIVNCIPICASA